MYHRIRTSFLPILLLISMLWGGSPARINLYILPFENIENDPSVDWLRSGMMDMLNLRFEGTSDIQLHDKNDLESLMSNRNRLLHQPRGTRNFLLLGKFNRKLDGISINIQLIDVASWEEIDKRQSSGKYSNIPALNDKVVEAVQAMLTPFLPEIEKKDLFTDTPSKAVRRPKPQLNKQVEEMGASIDIALSDLEESMDYVIGARVKPSPDEPVVKDNEWSLDISGEDFTRENPELRGNTEMLMKVLDELTGSPYNVELSKPKFEYIQDKRTEMDVVLPVTYSLKEHLIKDMLHSLPYSGLEQNGSLTIFYFNKDKFNFPAEAIETIKTGNYRAIPVIRFFDKSGKVVVMITDSPEKKLAHIKSDQVKLVYKHHFSPLIMFTVGGWSLQVAMETVDIPVNYNYSIPVDLVSQLSRVSIKFVPEPELEDFLLQNL